MASKVIIVTTNSDTLNSNFEYLDTKYLDKYKSLYIRKSSAMNKKQYLEAREKNDKSIFTGRPFVFLEYENVLIILCKDSLDQIDCFLDRLVSTFSKKENNSAGIEFNPSKSDIYFILHFTNDVKDVNDPKPEKLIFYDLHTYKERFDSNIYKDFSNNRSRILLFSHSSNFIHAWILSKKDDINNKLFMDELDKIIHAKNNNIIESISKGDFVALYQNLQ